MTTNGTGNIDMSGFKGVFPANPTPVKADGSIHEEGLRAILEDNMSHGVGGFWVAGSTGEGPILSEQQRDTVARISGETTKGKALAIMHVGAISTDSAVKGAKAAAESGCAAICCVPPFFFRPNTRAIIEHYKAVADAADGLPLFAYNLPALTNVEFLPDLMDAVMREVPTLKGLKHSAQNFALIRDWKDRGLACFSGSGRLPLPALNMGAVGSVDAPLSLTPWLYTDLYEAYTSGDMERAQARQDEVQKVVDLVLMYDAAAHVCKAILSERLGIDMGESIRPNNRLTDDEKAVVLAAAKKAGALDAPVATAV
ncbi:MAG: dihydrodipicolinate synthase family protein [Chloroflexi bacterium]|jgi:N-acetylneuraminate lyase|nr:dihydrodipicolinate synthase family protein [Chloroflexota bacterium]MBT4072916.1 dihydrodipicolinate synthase family protein [Chloroflexota bacterium]MBT4514964.1 dihydrodipicolinate synthase family protein [Chloroflexota bacterium]MBT5320522.1 dihydrodipicolinate synthase family protein [Chloroflexota bacterium]